ncbi:MAG TPA: ABC transporter substrate-binding protein/permease [Myxococcaceae bacterium]|nr:ABC transporter substrate-binding protein/permease [Myxococcaceae bacterium]
MSRATRAFALLSLLLASLSARAQEQAPDPSAAPPEGAAPLVVGLSGKYPPFNTVDPAGALVGFDVEFAEAVCAELGRPCAFRILPWDGILAALLAGNIDVIIGSMGITEERSRAVTFTRPYYESGAQLFVREGRSDPQRPGFRVGVTLGTTYEHHLREALPQAEIVTYKGEVEIVQDVQVGRLDGMVTDRLVGQWMLGQLDAPMAPHGPPLFVEAIGIPTAPGNDALHAELDAAVGRLRASPFYEELFARYFGTAGGAELSTGLEWGKALPLLARGLWMTVKVSGLGLLLGAALSFVLAFALLGFPSPLRTAFAAAVDLVRATPFMVQLFALYFGLPAVGVQLSAMNAAVLAIGLHSSAYLAELLKGAYQGIPRGQHQAASTLGLSRMQSLRHVILPQMIPALTAPVLNTTVAMVKDSAIASVISVPELTLEAQKVIGATFQPLEIYAVTALLYACITVPLLLWGRAIERRHGKQGLVNVAP